MRPITLQGPKDTKEQTPTSATNYLQDVIGGNKTVLWRIEESHNLDLL